MAEADGSFVLRIERSMTGLEQLGGWVDAIAVRLGLSRTAEYALRLCLEEAAANVVMHGEANGGDADFVAMRVEPGEASLRVSVEDRCGAFDPLSTGVPALPSLDDTRVGGLGIHLMRQYAQALSYERAGGVNRLTLTIGR